MSNDKFLQPADAIEVVEPVTGSRHYERVEPVTDGVIRLVRVLRVWTLEATVGDTTYIFRWGTTSESLARASFEEERYALSCGQDITDPASGWVPVE